MKHFAFLCLGVALLAACQKADDLIICPPIPVGTFAELRAAAPATQRFTFALAQAQSIRTSGGATVAFGPNAYILPNGNVATGQAELRVREIYTVPDMVLANMPTTAPQFRQVLISGGEFNIQVWQGSSRLRLANVSPTGVIQRFVLTSPVPATGLDTSPMLLWNQPGFASIGNSPDSTGWIQVGGATANPLTVPTAGGFYTAALPLDSLSNWNIDQFWLAYRTNGSGNFGVEVPAGTPGSITRVYMHPVGFNGLGRCYLDAPSTTRWTTTAPYGARVEAIVLQERDGQLYYGTQRLTTAANAVAAPPLEALSAAEVIQRIRQL